ncbi:phosphoribosyl-ATP diphosphatase [Saccharolobus solfataricus]|uniref:Phosphoribosyl-ATP pyrophosphatase n=4 Tax=Saccharolobus solfataricus TaxID=2287 RepID=HIS2_SACS2|nr:phosphoribosyl-ATP diphosphatase [Saccharolobus solfataricus]O33776.3 RecName: Full=Phosphoribosyl-ATP pyrophosphatase; Short=PRA-PH [Saccharolobus solfataricus P2]AAB63024.1 phosphoribosyl-ATP pyrophosphohydrolase [Saccharolobus solfataricus P2]AKA73939.1 phosphoribosyl-ATP diphosphatase [Saccharolobus solfataricus]AKA76636.1 phosphoribosyl-ATP diphosphatase [Saccharolobus solfataricus]AKA79330.1 phosphoribosyl-ATP diphosphatase [Saccharolobus solfataricus]AZF68416.1 phosphoribosyl-ATP di
MSNEIVDELYKIILDRIEKRPTGSYTAEIVNKGKPYVARKVGEESVETIVASLAENKERFISEVADLIYHLLVLMALEGVTPEDIYRELERRRK